MENPIDILWANWNDDADEVPSIVSLSHAFGVDGDNKKSDVFYGAIYDAKEVAFKAGFKTALKLLIGE